MDHDRRSAVSSFYGERRSHDALRNPGGGASSSASGPYDPYAASSPPAADPRARRDSNSTFFNPDAVRTPGSAGYNSKSYFDTGREEPVKGTYEDEERAAAGYGYDRGGSPDTKVDVGAPASGWDVYADFNNAGPKYSSAFAQPQHECAIFLSIPFPMMLMWWLW